MCGCVSRFEAGPIAMHSYMLNSTECTIAASVYVPVSENESRLEQPAASQYLTCTVIFPATSWNLVRSVPVQPAMIVLHPEGVSSNWERGLVKVPAIVPGIDTPCAFAAASRDAAPATRASAVAMFLEEDCHCQDFQHGGKSMLSTQGTLAFFHNSKQNYGCCLKGACAKVDLL